MLNGYVMQASALDVELLLQVMSNRDSGAAAEMAAPAPPPMPEQMLLPVDLVPATRRGLLLIVDSNNAQVFTQLRTIAIGEPPLLLLSPACPPDIVRVASVVR
jgi:Protein SCAI